MNPVGAKNIGETGICGTAAAIAGAVCRTTGRRVRGMPTAPHRLPG